MNWPLWFQRAVVWLNTGDNGFNILVLLTAPLFVVCIIGLLGSGA